MGVTPDALRHRLRNGGPWRVLLPGVYFVGTGTPSRGQQETAAVLYAGRGAVLTGLSALICHRIRAPMTDIVDVLVPIGCQRRDMEFVRLHRTSRMPEHVYRFGGLRYAMAARAVGDTVREMDSLREVRAVVADAVQRGRCELGELVAELTGGPARGSALFRAALSEVIGGSRSAAEAELRELIIKARLDMPLFNASVYDGEEFIARPDAWYPDLGIAIEVDSTEWHVRAEDHDRDVERQTRMGKHLIIVLRFKPRAIRREPDKVVAEIGEAIERARGRAPLGLRTVRAGDALRSRS